ncbi:Crp/Fnr family transcriptional regulator [Ramlibacter sp.]|uniref:Crp/Fnr family transcriptional regulator n=1 Tax=Ramlibacter sp. TaxID=1917967 RepID=UPI0035B273C9
MSPHPTILASWDACLGHTAEWLATPSLGQVRQMTAGTLLYAQGMPHRCFYLIREGYVQCAMLHGSGRRLLLELMGPGTMFGEGAAFDGLPRYVDAQAVTDVVVSAYAPEDIVGAGERATALMADIIRIMASKQRVLASKLLAFNSEDPEERLRHLLHKLVSVQRRASPDTARARQVWLSQENLGEMCGMSRISAARALRRLAELGLVRTHPRFVEVLDPAGLAVG